MASKTEICNLAISHLGIGKEIADLDTENSQEANACRRFYDLARDQLLRDYPWTFATKYYTLELVSEAPNSEWAYSYRYPTDAISIHRVVSGIRNDNRQTRVPWRKVQGPSGLLIYTDQNPACIVYTAKTEDPSYYTPDFTMGFSMLLAHYVAPRITGGDPFGMAGKVMEKYLMHISNAKANAANEDQDEQVPDSEFTRIREGYGDGGYDDNNGGYY